MIFDDGVGGMNTEVLSCSSHLAVAADLFLNVETKGTVQNMVYYKRKAKLHLQHCIESCYTEAP